MVSFRNQTRSLSVVLTTAQIMFRRQRHGTSLCFSTAGSQVDSLSILPSHHGIASGASAPEYSRFLLLNYCYWTYNLGFSLARITSSLCRQGTPELHRHTLLSLVTVFLHSIVFLLHFSHFSAPPLRQKNSEAYLQKSLCFATQMRTWIIGQYVLHNLEQALP